MKSLFTYLRSVFRQLGLLRTSEGRIILRLKASARLSRRHPAQSVPGNLTHLEGMTLHYVARQTPEPVVAVEVGSFLGKSTTYLCRALDGRKAKLVCVDTWNNEGMSRPEANAFEQFLRHLAPYRHIIEPIRATSEQAARTFNQPVNLLWIDGDHSYDGCKSDILFWLPKVKPGAFVCFHDYGNPCGVRQAVDELVKDHCSSYFQIDSLFVGRYEP